MDSHQKSKDLTTIEFDSKDVYTSFINQIDVKSLNQLVDNWISNHSKFDIEYWSQGGAYRAAIGWLLDQKQARTTSDIVDLIMNHYNKDENSTPPKMALRQAMAARLIKRQADKELRKHWQIDEDLINAIVIKLKEPSDVYELNDSLLDTILER